MQILRTYHLDVEINADTNEGAIELADEMIVGLALTRDLIVPVVAEGFKVTNDLALVRFSGPRSELEVLVDRLDVRPTEKFDPNFLEN